MGGFFKALASIFLKPYASKLPTAFPKYKQPSQVRLLMPNLGK